MPSGPEHQTFTSGIQAVHLLQEANDIDFDLEVKFESPMETDQYQQQGVLVKESDNRFLRFDF